jgi:hypothetical protein
MTLEDALTGLKNYWKVRPDGGTREELIAMARLKGFEEPLLNVWLDVFLQGFLDQGRIATATYAALAAVVATVGPTVASTAAESVFVYLMRNGSALDTIRKQGTIDLLNARITKLSDQILALASMATTATAALSTNPDLPLFLAVMKSGKDALESQRSSVGAQRDKLVSEIR